MLRYKHMLNPFPIQFLALVAYLILRVFVAGVLIFLSLQHFKYRDELKHILTLSWWPYGTFSSWSFIIGELLIGIFILVGAHTQYAMLLVMAMSLKLIIMRPYFDHHSLPSRMVYVLLFGASLSLFITGAGALAFDLPL